MRHFACARRFTRGCNRCGRRTALDHALELVWPLWRSELSELGDASRQEIGALTGVAPYDRSSGSVEPQALDLPRAHG
ncbi:MAG: hypothetical protein SGJ09_11480, partial [Phycisphaerae bacterium]|nr:hypothetical protein [Phycisphaerae bacterium]